MRIPLIVLFVVLLVSALTSAAQPRQDIPINTNWRTTLADSNKWQSVDIPHNWDDYGGYRRLLHGNLHGSAVYTKSIEIKKQEGRRYFLWFEGVGSYAAVKVNGQLVGTHAGGRTSFTLDITHAVKLGNGQNTIEVRADHPADIRDLPWVCGGCSDERGFSEGSQPFGIFRPVHLLITNDIRIEPFGVHIWNDTTVTAKQANCFVETEIRNYNGLPVKIDVVQTLFDTSGAVIATTWPKTASFTFTDTITLHQKLSPIYNPRLWSPSDPYRFVLVTEIMHNGKLVDRNVTGYGIRRIHWSDPKAPGPHPFTVNGKPVFLNGVAEYEHRIGNSHAFTDEEIRARVEQIKAAGFNAFRDAHQPHNLYYKHFWDSLGILWWPQYSAHIWFDSPEFRKNFKQDLIEWVKERRNSPSVILWGLQNESKLPEDFAKECADIIRKLDPTASSQRLIVTCNGGAGTDWDVPQNWTGTYGGDPKTYGTDLIRQILVGEYGAWRTADLHGDTANSEERMCTLMEEKIHLADSVKSQVAGHFMWLYSSHDNPGRVQSGEGKLPMDRIGPVNYKGLLTEWEEPLDPWYLYKANFTDPDKDPMVYIVSHTWPDRWETSGIRSGIVVYSNCDTIELFNGPTSLGKRTRHGIGTHFQWDSVEIKYPTLEAVAHRKGKQVATDEITLTTLRDQAGVRMPLAAPRMGVIGKLKSLGKIIRSAEGDILHRPSEIINPANGYNYLYRVNCGGETYSDHNKDIWAGDRHYTGGKTWGSTSWTDDYKTIPPFFASQRTIFDSIDNTADGSLFQSFRYGLQKLAFTFPVAPGEYRVELYFIEPWLGTGSPKTDCSGWRVFDVAVNGHTVIKDLDIWKEAEGRVKALKKVVNVRVTGNTLVINFPKVAAGQALISAIAIATKDKTQKPAPASPDTSTYRLEPAYDTRPVNHYRGDTTDWNIEVGVSDKYALNLKYHWDNPDTTAKLEIRLADSTLIRSETVTLKTTAPDKWNYISTTTGTMINAGKYLITLTVPTHEGLKVDDLQVQ
jgi:beta-galactosidase